MAEDWKGEPLTEASSAPFSAPFADTIPPEAAEKMVGKINELIYDHMNEGDIPWEITISKIIKVIHGEEPGQWVRASDLSWGVCPGSGLDDPTDEPGPPHEVSLSLCSGCLEYDPE